MIIDHLFCLYSMVIIQFTDWKNKTYADPICSLVISALILASSIPLVKACVRMLLQSVPSAIDLTAIRAELLSTDGVVECHELHIWQLNSDKVVASVHVLVEEGADWMKLCDRLKLIFHSHGIHNSTLQPEFVIRDRRTHQVIKQGLMDTCHEPVCGDTDCSKKFCCPPVLPPTTPLLVCR
jgi:zinc transporter 1